MDSSERIVFNEGMNITGLEKDGVTAYKGIPYAEAPIGNLRFAPPKEKEQWKETLDCTKFGNIAIQQGLAEPGSTPVHGANESEDCLNLNIWAPADAKIGGDLPVYVWIHGGAYVVGSGQEPEYDGTVFAKEGVIVVTINYRLGALGFLSLDSFRKDNPLGTTGNWGTLDQILALKWVQKNIWKFGGDKDKVTIGGESAGGNSVFNMIMSPLAAGLFRRAILESSTINRMIESSKNYDGAVTVAGRIAAKLGTDDSEEGIRTLRSLDAIDIMGAAVLNLYMTDDQSYDLSPTGDDVVIPEDFVQAIKHGRYNNVEMIIGNNGAEGAIFTKKDVTETEFNHLIDFVFSSADAVTVKDHYAEKKDMTVWAKTSDLSAMLSFNLGTERIQKLFCANQDAAVYAYQYLHCMNNGTPPFHLAEIEFAFGHETCKGVPFEGDDRIIKDIMHGYWLNFIKNGDPNGKGLTVWERYSPIADSLMTFGKNSSEMSARVGAPTIAVLSPLYLP